jgi:cytoskeletal protein CcmA (bactofilin family)
MRKVIGPLVVCFFTFLVLSVPSASAKIITDQKGTVTIQKTEVVNDDLFIGAQNVVIDGTVNGDVFAGGQSVKIAGTVNGNVHAGANMVNISGTVKGNVYTGAQNVVVDGATIDGSLLVGAAAVDIDKNTTIGGSVLAGTGSLSLDAQVKRSVYAGAGSLNVGSDAKIGKDLYYKTGKNQNSATISSDAQVAGEVHKSVMNTPQKKAEVEEARTKAATGARAANASLNMISFLGALLVGFLYFKFAKKHFVESTKIVATSFWKSFGVGFLITISLIPGLIIMLITVVGIPLAGLTLLMVFLYGYLAKMVVGSALGAWMCGKFNWKSSLYGELVLGLIAIYILKILPVVGLLSGLVVFWAGLGALTLRLFSKPE